MGRHTAALATGKDDAGLLHLLIGQQPHQRFIMQIDDLHAVAERVEEVAAKAGNQLLIAGFLAPFELQDRSSSTAGCVYKKMRSRPTCNSWLS